MIKNMDVRGIINSMGLVFGDIGTSPIYTLTVIFIITKLTEEHVLGVLSLIFWTLIILVTIEYSWLAMSLGKKGEGGTIVLKEILVPLLKSGRKVSVITFLSYVGISFLLGDGVITPAISILSAVEGLRVIPGLEAIHQNTLILIAGIIAIGLFSIQRKGTEKIAWVFGPLMILWFGTLAFSGVISIFSTPEVLKAINPYYAVEFVLTNGWTGFFVLSEVILCATGGEALYADMGHLGKEPIIKAWKIVFVALVLNYLGQGAFMLRNPNSTNVLFEMIYQQAPVIYIPFLILSVLATIIASQAMISGMFSIVYQGISTRIAPLLKIDYTSEEMKSQIYISVVNWLLLISVLFVMYEFKESHKLAAAYGLTVTGSMVITGIMMTLIFYIRKDMLKSAIAFLVTIVDFVYLLANMYKIPHGGYWSITIAAILLSMILIYTSGQKRLYRLLKPMVLDDFLKKYNMLYMRASKIKGTALFFARDMSFVPQYITHTMFDNGIIYEDNVVISISLSEEPFGVNRTFKEEISKGLRVFEIKMGYMEVIDLVEILRAEGIDERTIFYGEEEIITDNVIWRIFALMKKLSPSFVQFYKLPSDKLHGVVTRFEM
ncbi:MAG: system potassium uptake protein [Methanolobus sp.]|jgi:KUP system potassium uptake protein|uniref:Probable potassium transport system protein Kup n=1 Tax=Methanolobus vulcani TaxID=38026 RepID=A0A7Z7B1X7_9EURY|nr:KUP/HAK/KT family potassium transporter [Methanolobus vulcani]MDI3486166.1 system potassium uptake protein [Methanolobus sp.]MDK2825072.1 system potassium uptake protein [Methanolobus sp.]MDK2939022.1 system potassium uptake protein [Methanolobus sp.]SDF87858.1 KUP system potassium uptake protein [Methanolobus vulcani]